MVPARLNLVQMQNPESIDDMLLVREKGLHNVPPRSGFVVSAWLRTLMHNWSNAYFQYRSGTLEDEQWRALVRDMEDNSRYAVLWEVGRAGGSSTTSRSGP